MKVLLVFVFLFSISLEARVVFSGTASDLDIVVTEDNNDYTLFFNGSIPRFDDGNFFYKALDLALDSIPDGKDFTLALNSNGGFVHSVAFIFLMLENKCQSSRMASFKLSEHDCKITTYVPNGASCSSACISFYLLGAHRTAHQNANFGFHAMAKINGNKTDLLPPIKVIKEYVFYGANQDFLEGLANEGIFSSLNITYLNPDELEGSGIVDEIIRD